MTTDDRPTDWSIARFCGGAQIEQLRSAGFSLHRHQLDSQQRDRLTTPESLTDYLTLPLAAPLVRVWKDGRKLPADLFTVSFPTNREVLQLVDSAKLFRCFREGATIVLRDLQRYSASLRQLSWDLAAELGCAVSVGAFMSPPGGQNLQPHFDYADLVIVQLLGSKRWLHYSENATLPLDDNSWRTVRDSVDPRIPGPAAEPAGSALVQAGDVLFLPRGTSHAVQGAGEVSIHLSIALQAVTAFDVATELLNDVTRGERLRAAVPLAALPDQGAGVDGIAEAVGGLAELGETADRRELHWKLYRRSHLDMAETPVSLLDQYSAATADTVTVRRRPHLLHEVDEGQEVVTIRLRDRSIRLPVAAAPAVGTMLSGAEVRVRLRGAGTPTEIMLQQVAQALLAEAVVVPVVTVTGSPDQPYQPGGPTDE